MNGSAPDRWTCEGDDPPAFAGGARAPFLPWRRLRHESASEEGRAQYTFGERRSKDAALPLRGASRTIR